MSGSANVMTSPMRDVTAKAFAFRPHGLISISDPESRSEADRFINGLSLQTLRLSFHDIDGLTRGFVAPSLNDAASILSFVESVSDRVTSPRFLIHCHAGLSRSTAAAAIVLAMTSWGRAAPLPDDDKALAMELMRIEPLAIPNVRLMKAAEKLVPEWRGRLAKPVTALAKARDSAPGLIRPFSF